MIIRPARRVHRIPVLCVWHICLCLVLCCCGTAALAQCPFDRAVAVGEGSTLGSSVAVDAGENIYMTGTFSDTVRFGGTTFHATPGEIEVFLARFDRSMTLQWVQHIPGFRHAPRILADPKGNVYLAGRFANDVVIGGDTARSRGDYDILLVSYDPAGSPRWWTSGGGEGLDAASDVALDAGGNLSIAGRFTGTAWFGESSVTSRGGDDIFVATYDSAGNPLWARSAGGGGNDHGYALAADSSGNVYVTGLYQSTAWFGSDSIRTDFNAGLYVVSYDRNGAYRWTWTPSGTYVGAGYGVATGARGQVYVTGDFDGDMETGGGSTGTYGLTDIFLLALDSAGRTRWVRHGGGALHDRGNRVAVAPDGDIAVTGGVNEAGSGVVYFEDRTLDVQDANIFVARYAPDGTLRCATAAGADQLESANGISFGPSGEAYIAGSFNFYTSLGELELEGNPSPRTSAYLAAVRYDLSTSVPASGGRSDEPSLLVAPNPGNGDFIVRYGRDGETDLRLMSMAGSEVWRGRGTGETRIDATGLPSGVYLLEAAQGSMRMRRMVVIR